jgi:probable rRNA maturation factor
VPERVRPLRRARVQVDFSVDETLEAAWDEPRMRRLVESILARELQSEGPYEIALHLVDDATIKALNREHRRVDSVTDVLSFPLHDVGGMRFVTPPGEVVNLGDVVISHPRALAQAAEFGHSPARELGYLVAHGVLHVLGYDHEEPAEQHAMRAREEEALAAIGLTRDASD